ncbi:MAG: DedA family protein [Bacteroidetes bacterium QH_6_64_77]|nr:MAG: DedA family protein [Bacteroidetes bacterium QH_6_64_77]
MKALSPVWAYLTLLIIAYGENVMPPIPGDVVVVFGGYLASRGQLHLGVVILLSTVGGAVGFMTMYAVGYKLGRAVRDPDRLRWFPQESFDRAQRWIEEYGYGVIAANRFLSGARSVIYAGYAVGENWGLVVQYLRTYGRVVLTLLVLLALGLGARWYWRRRRAASVTDSESPSPEQD